MNGIKILLPRLQRWALYGIAFMAVTPFFINSIFMISWAALLLTSIFLFPSTGGIRPIGRRVPLFLLFGGIYLLYIIGMSYSVNIPEGLRVLEVGLPILLFPFGLILCTPGGVYEKKVLKNAMGIFHLSIVVLALWIFFRYWRIGIFSEPHNGEHLRRFAAKVSGLDPDYISFYLGFGIFLAASALVRTQRLFFRFCYGASILLQGSLLLLLASRSPILGTAAGCCVILFLRLKPGPIRWILPLSLLVVLAIVIRFTPAIRYRVLEVVETPLEVPVGLQFNSTNLRVGIFKCTWQLITEHPLIGIGPGSDRTLLPVCYSQFPTKAYQKPFYNAHDTYLNFWLITGLPGFLLFIGLMVYSYVIAIRHKDHPMLYLLILMSVCFLTENILTRQAGVVFFYLFICLMIASHGRDKGVTEPVRR